MSLWNKARHLANNTPATRNRYVDFLRGLSILFVITGHWLISTALYDDTTQVLVPVDVLSVIPSTQWLTWLFQVMPVFFIVGGYSNAISLESAKHKQLSYAQWLTGRLHRLLTPLLLLVVCWAVIALLMHWLGAHPETIRFATKAALVPTWFLAIYTMIVLLAPLSYQFWRRYGWGSLTVFVALAAMADVLFFQANLHWLGWSNYFWVWLAVHHLGFAWHDGRLGKPVLMLCIAGAALGLLYTLILHGPYPLAMAGSPDKAVSNSLPPKITLLILGLVQFGVLHALEKPMQKLLSNAKLWTLTVLVNSMIMTVYLWHMTILVLVFGVAYFCGGLGMSLAPGSEIWWASRPLWLASLTLLLIPVALSLSPLERLSAPQAAGAPSSLRLIAGAMLAGLGIALASLKGFSGDPGSLFSWSAMLLLWLGARMGGIRLLPQMPLAKKPLNKAGNG